MKTLSSVLGITLLLVVANANAAVTTYCCDATAEAAYVAALATEVPTATTTQESFEAGPWVATRTFVRSSVTNFGFRWSRSGNGMRTSTAGSNVHDGTYLMFVSQLTQPYHPVPDGFRLSNSTAGIHGVGGWFRGNGAKLSFTVDGDPNRVDFTGAEATVTGWKFLGFIDTVSFTSVDVREADEGGGAKQARGGLHLPHLPALCRPRP